MTDLSYTNKDGLNLYEGFNNGFNYHKDGKDGGEGYEHGGYPEITGETSDYTDTSYKTGDNPDFFDNGNVWEQPSVGPGPGPEPRLISMSGIYKKGLKSATTAINENEHAIVTNPEYIYSDYEDIPDEYKYAGLYWISWGEDKYVLGNTSLITDWGYNGQAVETSCPICVIAVNPGELGGRAIVVMSDDIYDEQTTNYNFADFEFKDGSVSSLNYEESVKNFIYSNPCVAWGDESYSFLNSSPLSEEEFECLKSADGKNIKLTADGVEYDAVISYDGDSDMVTLNISDSDMYVYAGKSWSVGESSPYYLFADKSDPDNPSTIENNTAFSVSVDLDSITESSASAGGGK